MHIAVLFPSLNSNEVWLLRVSVKIGLLDLISLTTALHDISIFLRYGSVNRLKIVSCCSYTVAINDTF
jgi:hypothetical protein